MRRLLNRLRTLWAVRDADADLESEIEAHRALHEDALRRSGVPAGEAAQQSRRALGNVTLAREEARGVRVPQWIEEARQDTAYAWRTIRRAPGFSAAVIGVMALGLSATTAVFGLVDRLVLADLPVRQPDQLVWLKDPSFSYPVFTELRTRGGHIFDGFFAWNTTRLNVEWAGEPEPATVLMASGGYFPTLGIGAAMGRPLDDRDDRGGGGPDGLVAVISHACWLRRFAGDPAVVGRTVRIDQHPFTIVGVTPAGFFGVAAGLAPDITIPLTSIRPDEALRSPSSAWLHLMGRLRDGLTVAAADAALQAILPAVLAVTVAPDEPAERRARYLGRQVSLAPGRTGFSRVRNQFAEPLWLLMALVGLLLATATASAANLLLARGVARRREIAVRLAIGASRSRLVRQMLIEAGVWALLGAAIGLPLATNAGYLLVALMTTREAPIALDLSPDWRVTGSAAGLALITAAACAILPALTATRLSPGTMLNQRDQISGVRRRWGADALLVILQVAVTTVLLAGAALFVRSLQQVLAQDAGVEREAVIVLTADAVGAGYGGARLSGYYESLWARLAAVPGVTSASLSWYPPISESGSWTQSVSVDGAPLAQIQIPAVYFNAVSPGYFDTVGTALVKGREFRPGDIDGANRVAIVNESLVGRFLPGQDPIGRRISIGRNASRRDLEIVGVVRDAKYQRLQEGNQSVAYLPHRQLAEAIAGANLTAEVRVTGSVASVTASVRQAARDLDPRVPLHVESVADRIRASLVKERVLALLSTAIGIAALLLASTALYGLLAFRVARQVPEIGVRLALGASRTAVLRGVLRESLLLTAAGVATGLAGALALSRYARAFLYETSPLDPTALAGAAALVLIVAIAAALFPARRAATVDPIAALRAE